MNKREVSEIRRKFFAESDTLVMNRVLTVVVNPNHDTQKVRYQNVVSGVSMTEHEQAVYYDTLKKVLSTKIGKKLIEYAFPNSAYEEAEPQSILYNVTQSAFLNTDDTEAFVNQIADNLREEAPYAIIAAHCTYTVFKRNTADEEDKYSTAEYRFIITAICPIEPGDGALAYNFSNDEFIKSADNKLFINRTPSDGFLFPAFNDRSSDVNSVLYYTKSPKKPNISIVEDVLGCSFTLSPEQESAYYKKLMGIVAGDELSYELILAMENEIQTFIDENSGSTEIPIVNKQSLYSMVNKVFHELGIDTRNLEIFDATYGRLVGDTVSLTAANLIDSKLLIEVDGVTLNVKNATACHVESVSIDGTLTTRIVVNVTEPTFNINGMSVKK